MHRRTGIPVLITLLVQLQGGCATNWSISGKNGSQQAALKDADVSERLRRLMVREQLEGREIRDQRVLSSMLKVPRHRFVPEHSVQAAYGDSALPLAEGQTISQPYIVAYMTQALELGGDEKVLEVGTGSGYQAAILAELTREVYTIEIVPQLAERAQRTLRALGYASIRFRVGDGYQGWPESAPFDAIMVTAAPDHVPQPLVDQLKPGGRMIIPVGGTDQELILVEKGASGTTRRSTIPVRFVPMTGKALDKTPRN